MWQLILQNIFNRVIVIKELINNFKGESWEAKQYNVLTHNCQIFAVQIIKILKKNKKKKLGKKKKIK